MSYVLCNFYFSVFKITREVGKTKPLFFTLPYYYTTTAVCIMSENRERKRFTLIIQLYASTALQLFSL